MWRRPRLRARPAPGRQRDRTVVSRALVALWLVLVVLGAAALVAAMRSAGPAWLGEAGAVAVTSAYTWGLAARTGGRPVVFGGLALVLGVLVVVLDQDVLRTGAAVLTTVLTAVLAVMVTVPAVHFLGAAREVLVAFVVSAVGGLATLGWEPVLSLSRFQYTALGLAFVAALVMVYRLGAGFHGLGTRGIVIVAAGTLLLGLTLGYAELLRRYGTPGAVDWALECVRWSHRHLGAFPRPIQALLGIPALAWGTHMRARRRQGWWVCAFGVAATAPVAYVLLDPERTLTEVGLANLYALVVGLALGFVVIRADLALTGTRGRRVREHEEATAVRPEPRRTEPLL